VSAAQPETVYVYLLNEGTDAWAPVKAERVGPDAFRLLPPQPRDEEWQFPPGSIVRCERQVKRKGAEPVNILVVVAAVGAPHEFAWLLGRAVEWECTGDAKFPFRARVDGLALGLYSGDWPSENPYTLYVNGSPVFGLGDLPSGWKVPD
jgi:hypothetical protein